VTCHRVKGESTHAENVATKSRNLFYFLLQRKFPLLDIYCSFCLNVTRRDIFRLVEIRPVIFYWCAPVTRFIQIIGPVYFLLNVFNQPKDCFMEFTYDKREPFDLSEVTLMTTFQKITVYTKKLLTFNVSGFEPENYPCQNQSYASLYPYVKFIGMLDI